MNVNTIVDNGRIYIINGIEPMTAAKVRADIILGDAPEAVQDRVIDCIRTALMHSPCAMMMLGRVDLCRRLSLGAKKPMPCLVIDDAWDIAQVGTRQQAIELKLDFSFPN